MHACMKFAVASALQFSACHAQYEQCPVPSSSLHAMHDIMHKSECGVQGGSTSGHTSHTHTHTQKHIHKHKHKHQSNHTQPHTAPRPRLHGSSSRQGHLLMRC
mmetsp:Transcript_16922/g.46764  ORF Transcript_16922/g.46764 Transcript_16922/m.46764 type:complete len:103 (+) Transcript_16922:795-1103(+)